MTQRLKPGDEVTCRIFESKIVSAYSSYDDEKTFQIIALDEKGYYIYVPAYHGLRETVVISAGLIEALDINKKYQGGLITYISPNQISKVRVVLDGYACCRCGDFYFQSEPNQPDGTMKCWSCRTYPFR